MSDARDYVHTFDLDKTQALVIAQKTASKLETKQINLIAVVESVGEYAKSEDATIRSKAIHFLVQILASLPATFLSRQQLQVICQFFCDRVTDGGAVLGLRTLQGLPRFNDDMAISTLRAMLEQLQDLQLRPQIERFQAMELLNALMLDHRKALQTLGSDVVTGIIDLVSGEKDPRNLMIIFSVLRVVMMEWNISEHAELLFDGVFCYFPITFRPRPDDPYGITAQDLKDRLKNCVSASTYFAPYAFPQLLEKLDSNATNVKRDVLQTILACVQMFDLEAITSYAITLWDSLKYEIFNAQEEDLEKESILVLEAIVSRLNNSGTASINDFLPTFLGPVMKECLDRLQTPEHKQAEPAGKILSSMGKQSIRCLSLVTGATLPSLLSLYQATDTIEKRRAILKPVLLLLESGTVASNLEATDQVSRTYNPLLPFKDQLLTILSQALMASLSEEITFRILAMKCLIHLCRLPQVTKSNEVGLVVQYINEILSVSDDCLSEELKDAAIASLLEISRRLPDIVVDVTIPKFLAELPDSGSADSSSYSRPLEVLARLSVRSELSSMIVRRLFSRLDAALICKAPVQYYESLLNTICFCLDQQSRAPKLDVSVWYEKVISLVKQVASASVTNQAHPLLHEKTMCALGKLTCFVVHEATLDKQETVAMQVHSLFTDQPVFIGLSVVPDFTATRKLSVILSTYFLAGLTPAVKLENDAASTEMVKQLKTLALSDSLGDMRRFTLQYLALLVNKFMKTEDLDDAVSMICDNHQGLLCINPSTTKVRIAFCISKALVLRVYAVEEILDVLLGLLAHPQIGANVARGFALLFAPDELLMKKYGANIRLLAKQKAFVICSRTIKERFATALEIAQSNYLIALCGILKNMEANIVLPEIKLLMPLLLQSLELDDSAIRAAALSILILAVKESPISVEEHMSSLITRLLRLAAYEYEIDSDVRFNAIHCLKLLPGNLKLVTLIPYLKTIDRGINATLDDPRRSVRKETVDCRAVWLAIDEPGMDD